jgi:hypothetical protein
MDQSANQSEKEFEEEAHSKSQKKDKNWTDFAFSV